MAKSKWIFLPALATLLLLGNFIPLPDDKGGEHGSAADSITIPELRDHLYYLSSDQLEGRMTASKGFKTAAEYVVAQYRNAGLTPIIESDDGAKSFLQPYPVYVLEAGKQNRIEVTRPGGNEIWSEGNEYIYLTSGAEVHKALKGIDLVFAGYGINEPHENWDDYAGLDVKGKAVAVYGGIPLQDGKPALSPRKLPFYQGFRGYANKRMTAMLKGAVAVFYILPPGEADSWDIWKDGLGMHSVFLGTSGKPPVLKALPNIPSFVINPHLAKKLFPFPGSDNAEKTVGSMTLDIEFESTVVASSAYNIVGMVEGTDSALKHEFVSVGSHMDHVGAKYGVVFNGADDGGSAPVAVIEAAEAMAISPPKRSVIFVIYSGEELGLWGSRWFTDHPPVPIKDIIVNINADMVGRNDNTFPQGLYAIGSAKRCKELKKILIAVNEERVGMPLDFRLDVSDPEDLFDRSDHANFNKHGIPIVFFFSGLHEDYHQPSDDVEKINFEKVQMASRLIYELARELGDREKRLCAN